MKIFHTALSMAVLFLSCNLYGMGDTEAPEELINQTMCREYDHHFDLASKECIYCAQHLRYNVSSGKCEGNLSPLGKCYGSDHFHAATLQCMYCADGHEFNEETRKCESKQIILAD